MKSFPSKSKEIFSYTSYKKHLRDIAWTQGRRFSRSVRYFLIVFSVVVIGLSIYQGGTGKYVLAAATTPLPGTPQVTTLSPQTQFVAQPIAVTAADPNPQIQQLATALQQASAQLAQSKLTCDQKINALYQQEVAMEQQMEQLAAQANQIGFQINGLQLQDPQQQFQAQMLQVQQAQIGAQVQSLYVGRLQVEQQRQAQANACAQANIQLQGYVQQLSNQLASASQNPNNFASPSLTTPPNAVTASTQ